MFDKIDRGGDVIRRGAFERSLAAGVTIPLLWQHRNGAVIGRIDAVREDEKGLRVIGSLGDGFTARKVGDLLRRKSLDGLSFGYRVRKSAYVDGVRELSELDLVEVSIVAQPMQPAARIHAIEPS